MTLKSGSSAPAFTLKNQDGLESSLASHLGQKVILYFYPAASSPSCTNQACELRDNVNSLKSLGYTVLGVSPDEPKKLKRFQEKESLNFELLSDPDNAVQQAYGAYGTKSMYGKEYMGTIRSTFVVDEQGNLSHAFYNVKAKGHIDMLRTELGI